MLTEYMLTDEQRKQIAEIDKQILDLQIKKSLILMAANFRFTTETKEEFEAVHRLALSRYATFGQPLIRTDAVVKINLGEKEE